MPVLRFLSCALALVVIATACTADRTSDSARTAQAERSPTAASGSLVDDFGDTLRLPMPPARVVSLNPTTTEVVFALDAGGRLVGRSRWDVWPAAAQRVPSVGDGIRPNVEAILATRPALVVLYASADNRAAARALRAAGVMTLAVRIDSIAEFRRVTQLLANVLGVPEAGRETVDSVDATLARVRRLTSSASRPTVLWRAWDAPLMVIAGGSYLTELIEIAGGHNIFADDPRPSPQVSFEEVLRRKPDLVLAGDSTSARELAASARWRTLPAVRDGHVLVIDGELLSRPSVRLGEAAVHLASRLHPELAAALSSGARGAAVATPARSPGR